MQSDASTFSADAVADRGEPADISAERPPQLQAVPRPLPRVLCIDDEPMFLGAIKRTLRQSFEVITANDGTAGLAALQNDGPFAVVISDMRMPGIDGAATLAGCAKISPHTARILLTGQTGVDAAMRAVNEGHVLRFLTKPYDPRELVNAVTQGVDHHRLLTAEQDVLERTLNGAVNVLTDVLGLTSPLLFTRTRAIRRIVKYLAERSKLKDAWKVEMAAMLSRLGCIAVPSETLERHFSGQALTASDEGLLRAHPDVASRLLARIPRLEEVAEMVRLQNSAPPYEGTESVAIGAEILRLALAFDARLLQGESVLLALHHLDQFRPPFRNQLLTFLREYEPEVELGTVHLVNLTHLVPEMILEQDVQSASGRVLVHKGTEVSFALIERLRRFAEGVGVAQPIRVRDRTA